MLKHLYELELIPIKVLHYKNWLSKSSGKFSLEKQSAYPILRKRVIYFGFASYQIKSQLLV